MLGDKPMSDPTPKPGGSEYRITIDSDQVTADQLRDVLKRGGLKEDSFEVVEE